jgi:hypothetical protein
MLWSWSAQAAPTALQLTPGACIAQQDGPCPLKLHVQWQQDEVMCLFEQQQTQALLCGAAVDSELSIEMSANLVLEWRRQSDQTIVQQRVIRLLQRLENDNMLQQRRLSWSLF